MAKTLQQYRNAVRRLTRVLYTRPFADVDVNAFINDGIRDVVSLFPANNRLLFYETKKGEYRINLGSDIISVNFVAVYSSAGTKLTASISSTDTTIPVVDTTDFPSSGYVVLGDTPFEIVSYSGKTATTLTGAKRGQRNTNAIAWAVGTGIDVPVRLYNDNGWIVCRITNSGREYMKNIRFDIETEDDYYCSYRNGILMFSRPFAANCFSGLLIDANLAPIDLVNDADKSTVPEIYDQLVVLMASLRLLIALGEYERANALHGLINMQISAIGKDATQPHVGGNIGLKPSVS